MDCQRILDEDMDVRYLSGELSEEEQVAFEHHFFACVACFERLQTLEAAQEALRTPIDQSGTESRPAARPRRVTVAPWAMAAAAVFVALSAGILLRSTGPGPASPSPGTSPGTGGTERPTAPTPEGALPNTVPPAMSRELELLADFDPPPYTPLTVRGGEDEAEAAFQQAMELYARKDFARALPGLRQAARLQPGRADVRFYLGVTELLSGEVGAAVEELRRAAELGRPGYSEPARFYLAMAYLRQGAPARAQARAELAVVAQSNIPQAAEARRRLAILDASMPPR